MYRYETYLVKFHVPHAIQKCDSKLFGLVFIPEMAYKDATTDAKLFHILRV